MLTEQNAKAWNRFPNNRNVRVDEIVLNQANRERFFMLDSCVVIHIQMIPIMRDEYEKLSLNWDNTYLKDSA